MTREEEIRQEVDLQLAGCFGNYSEGYEEGFIEGAKWADKNPTPCSVRMVDSQSYSKQELRDMGFAFDLNGNIVDPKEVSDMTINYVLNRVINYLENVDTDDYMDSGIFQMSDLINDFKKNLEIMKLWIARDVCNIRLKLFFEKPVEQEGSWVVKHIDKLNRMYYGNSISIDNDLFPEVTFENSPREIELKLC